MKRIVAVALLLLAGVTMMAPGHVDAATKKYRCQGKLATQVLTESGTLYFTEGDDVFYGSNEADDFLLPEGAEASGTDIVCGNGGNDVIFAVAGYGSIADGGSGTDFVVAFDGAKALGGSGQDYLVVAIGPDALADGGAGNDGEGYLPADIGPFEDYLDLLGPALDYIEGPGVWALWGATADGGANDDLVGGNDAWSLLGGSGRDQVYVGPQGAYKVDCGSNQDWIWYDNGGTSEYERRCERYGGPG